MANDHLTNVYCKLFDYANKKGLDHDWVIYSFTNFLNHYWSVSEADKLAIQVAMLPKSDIEDLLKLCPDITDTKHLPVVKQFFALNLLHHEDNIPCVLTKVTNFWFNYRMHSEEYQVFVENIVHKIGTNYANYIIEILRIYISFDNDETLLSYTEPGAILLFDFIARLNRMHDINLDQEMAFRNCFFLLDSQDFNRICASHESWIVREKKLEEYQEDLQPQLIIKNRQIFYKQSLGRVLQFPTSLGEQNG